MIGIIDYGVGNVQAIINIYNELNIKSCKIKDIKSLNMVSHIILPGVGSFDLALKKLYQSGLKEKLDHVVDEGIKPILGICVGMQMMTEKSEEGNKKGLCWIDGNVKKFNNINKAFSVPHMGWNNIKEVNHCEIFKGLNEKARFYFLHSYYFQEKKQKHVVAYTNYHGKFCASFRKKNLFGVQFHPEKSHIWGMKILKNFSLI